MRAKVGQWLSGRSRRELLWLSAFLSLVIGTIDYATRVDLSLSIFYLVPIAIAAWYLDLATGISLSLLCALLWLWADTSAKTYSSGFLPLWNAGIRLGFFLLVNYLIVGQHQAFKQEHQLARTDDLTGIYNRRFFIEMLKLEMERSRRYQLPFTLAYVDIDNFKAINDQYGHSEGDRLLKTVSKRLLEFTRDNDIVGRLGGDEFGVILPQVEYAQAYLVLARLHTSLTSEIGHGWSVGFSMGAITFLESPPASTDEAIAQADQIMYEIKRKGKNALELRVASPIKPTLKTIQQIDALPPQN